MTTSRCWRVALASTGELEVTTFCGNLRSSRIFRKPPEAGVGELEVVTFCHYLGLRAGNWRLSAYWTTSEVVRFWYNLMM